MQVSEGDPFLTASAWSSQGFEHNARNKGQWDEGQGGQTLWPQSPSQMCRALCWGSVWEHVDSSHGVFPVNFSFACLHSTWQATVHGIAKSRTRLKRLSMHAQTLCCTCCGIHHPRGTEKYLSSVRTVA